MNEAMQMVDRVKRELLDLHEGWLVVWNIFQLHILGISSSQLTFTPSFFRGVGRYTTNQTYWMQFHFPIHHIWVNYNDPTVLPHWNSWFILGKLSPNGPTSQVSEIL